MPSDYTSDSLVLHTAGELEAKAQGLTIDVSREALSDFFDACLIGRTYGIQPSFILDILPAKGRVRWSDLNEHQTYIVLTNLATICEDLTSKIERTRIEIMVAAAVPLQMEGGGRAPRQPVNGPGGAAQPAVKSEKASTRARSGRKYGSDVGLYIDDFEQCKQRNMGLERWRGVVCLLFLLAAVAAAFQKLIPFAPAPSPVQPRLKVVAEKSNKGETDPDVRA